METWLIYAILSIFIVWFYSFSFKIAAERNYNTSLLAFQWYLIWALITLVILFFKKFSFSEINNFYIIGFLAFLNALFFFSSMISRVESMKNIDTVIFFPIYKTIWPIIVTFISLFFFWEFLTVKEIIWIIVWISIPLFLITKKENRRQKNLSRWILLVFVTAILTAISSSASKEVIINWLNLEFYLLLVFLFWLFFSFISNKMNTKNWLNNFNSKWFLWFSFISWILHFLAFYVFTLSLEWNLAVVFTINSFSILIPIILSIIFYKEHFDFKKWVVIFLSIVSIILFI